MAFALSQIGKASAHFQHSPVSILEIYRSDISMYHVMLHVFQGMTPDEQVRTLRHEMLHQVADLNGCIALINVIDLKTETAMEEVQHIASVLTRISANIKGVLDALPGLPNEDR